MELNDYNASYLKSTFICFISDKYKSRTASNRWPWDSNAFSYYFKQATHEHTLLLNYISKITGGIDNTDFLNFIEFMTCLYRRDKKHYKKYKTNLFDFDNAIKQYAKTNLSVSKY